MRVRTVRIVSSYGYHPKHQPLSFPPPSLNPAAGAGHPVLRPLPGSRESLESPIEQYVCLSSIDRIMCADYFLATTHHDGKKVKLPLCTSQKKPWNGNINTYVVVEPSVFLRPSRLDPGLGLGLYRSPDRSITSHFSPALPPLAMSDTCTRTQACDASPQTSLSCKENVGWRRVVRNFTPS